MNIILFQPEEVEHPLPRNDARAWHILHVLRLPPGAGFDAGLINGPRGRGTLASVKDDSLILAFVWEKAPPALCPIHLLVGLPRPQTAKDILRDVTTLGAASIHFVCTDRGEPSYFNSNLWKSGEWKNCVINGAAQAFCTRLPEVTCDETLAAGISRLPPVASRIALDNYEASTALAEFNPGEETSVIVAVGSERGWSARERSVLKTAGFTIAHLGDRVLRAETACVAAVILVKAKLGLL